MKSFKKSIALLVAVSMIVGCVIGGALAWLTHATDPVVNTFTTSDIEVTLTETDRTYKMIPGWTIDKDPKVTVKAGSEDCYLFVKVEELNQLDSYIDYSVRNGWTKGDGTNIPANVYYREVAKSAIAQEFYVLGAGSKIYDGVTYSWTDDHVLVKPTVTKEMMNGLTTETYPKLKFTAYASQLYKNNTEKFEETEAWANAQPSSGGTSTTV